MKKFLCMGLVLLVMLGCLTSCGFFDRLTDKLESKSEAVDMVEDMLNALAERRMDDAKAMMHVTAEGNVDGALSQISVYLAGRKVSAMNLEGISVNSSFGTDGRVREEQVYYKVLLSDNSVIYVDATYISNKNGTGFSSFQIVLGVE